MNNQENNFFGTERVWKILLKLAPPVMFAQLVQALYNIVDSYFIGKYSDAGLAALSVIFPLQLLIIALAVGTGVGVNTVMSKYYGLNRKQEAEDIAGAGMFLAIVSWAVFALISLVAVEGYVRISLTSAKGVSYAAVYGKIVCCFSIGIFLESVWSKVLQAKGDMRTPMIAQIVGALINIVMDPLLIFGYGVFPELGMRGAAIATVIGQIVATVIVSRKGIYRLPGWNKMLHCIGEIYKAGIPNIVMQALYTVYIVGLNMILATFSDSAVTVLGLYYKLQTFFFIPLMGLSTCIVPVLSFNYAAGEKRRCKLILQNTVLISAVCMIIAMIAFECVPVELFHIFTRNREVLQIGEKALRIIGASFPPVAISLVFPIYFQALGKGVQSITLTILRQIVLLVPVAWVLSILGLNYVWWTFPITEMITAGYSLILYKKYPI